MSIIHTQSTIIASALGYSGPQVSPSTANVTTNGDFNPTVAGVDYRTNGTEWSSTASGSYTVSRGSWLDIGGSDEVWIQRTINSGSLTTDAGSGVLAMTSSRLFAVEDTSYPGGAVTCGLTVKFYSDSGGTTEIGSATFTLSAERQA